MVRTSLHLTKEALYAVAGQMKGNRLEITGCGKYPLPGNCLAGGAAADMPAIKAAVISANRELGNPCKRVDLLLENELAAIRPMAVPRMKKKQLTEFVRMELSRFRSFHEDSLFAYSIVEKQKDGLRILAGAMKRQIAKDYMELLAQCGMQVVSMAPALEGLAGLIGFLPGLQKQCVLAVLKEDREHVTLALFDAGIYQESNQLYCEGGVGRAQNRKLLLGQITAFRCLREIKGKQRGLDCVLLCGNWKAEEALWMELKEWFQEQVRFLEEDGCVAAAGNASVKDRYRLCEFCCATGNLLRRRGY